MYVYVYVYVYDATMEYERKANPRKDYYLSLKFTT